MRTKASQRASSRASHAADRLGDQLREVPVACVTLHPDSDVTRDALRDWVNDRIGKHERLYDVLVRDVLPKTMIGKLDRKTLRGQLADSGWK